MTTQPPSARSPHTHVTALLLAIVALLVFLLLWYGGAFSKRPHIVLITSGEGPYWDLVIAGAQQAADMYDAKLTVEKCKTDVTLQSQLLREAIQKKYDGIAVAPIEPKVQVGVLFEAAAGGSLVTLDSDSPVSRRLCFVGTDNYYAGRLCGQQVKQALPDGGDVIITIGHLDKENTDRRRQGVIDELLERPFEPEHPSDPIEGILGGPHYRVLATLVDDSDPNLAASLAAKAIKEHPTLKCFVGLLSYSTPAIVAALEAEKKTGSIKVVGFDADPRTLDAIEAGTVASSILQDQFGCGFHAVRILAENARGDRSGLPMFQRRTLPVEVINVDNASAVRRQLSGEPAATTRPVAGG